jgi:hypothetical protein
MYSSVRAARSAKSNPRKRNSSSSQPMPTPRITRPPDSLSSVATSLAVTSGLRWGRIRMPVARLTVVVRAATKASQIRGSGMSNTSAPGILPVGE